MEPVSLGRCPHRRERRYRAASLSDDDLLVHFRETHPFPGLFVQLPNRDPLHVTHSDTLRGRNQDDRHASSASRRSSDRARQSHRPDPSEIRSGSNRESRIHRWIDLRIPYTGILQLLRLAQSEHFVKLEP